MWGRDKTTFQKGWHRSDCAMFVDLVPVLFSFVVRILWGVLCVQSSGARTLSTGRCLSASQKRWGWRGRGQKPASPLQPLVRPSRAGPAACGEGGGAPGRAMVSRTGLLRLCKVLRGQWPGSPPPRDFFAPGVCFLLLGTDAHLDCLRRTGRTEAPPVFCLACSFPIFLPGAIFLHGRCESEFLMHLQLRHTLLLVLQPLCMWDGL